MTLTGLGYYQRRQVVRSRLTRVSWPEITLKWSLKVRPSHGKLLLRRKFRRFLGFGLKSRLAVI